MATAASLPARGPARTLVLADVLPGARIRADLDAAQAISERFTPFVVGGIVKAVIAGVAPPGAWWLVNRADRLGRPAC